MTFSGKPATAQMGAVLLLVAFFVSIIGVGAPAWMKSGDKTSGLWMGCLGPGVFENCIVGRLSGLPDYFYATIALALTGVIFLLLSTIGAFCSASRVGAIFTGIFAGLCLVISVLVYYLVPRENNSDYGDYLYWAFYLTGISGGISFIGALLLIPNQTQ